MSQHTHSRSEHTPLLNRNSETEGSGRNEASLHSRSNLQKDRLSSRTEQFSDDIEGTASGNVEEDEDLKNLLPTVKEIVPLTDDPSIQVLTFRFFVLAIIFIVPGAFIDTLNFFRTTAAAYSILFVQIACHPAGEWMARVLPNKQINLYFFSFNLNPGPWSIKETGLISIAAKSGATGNLATNALALVEIYFGVQIPPSIAIGFMWAIVFVGYSYAAVARNVVSYDPQFQWPQSLMQTALLQSQAEDSKARDISGKDCPEEKQERSHMATFFLVTGGMCLWQLLPEYLFPMTSSIALLCYIAPHNHNINFIGSGLGGMGFLNFSLDWANITSMVMLIPYWVQVIQFIGFVIGAWILLPIAKWTSLFPFKYGLMSNGLFTQNGDLYPANKLIMPDGSLNQTAYDLYGPVYLGSQRAWNMFFDYAAYVSGVVWVIAFAWDRIISGLKQGRKLHTDRLNQLHNAYEIVPTSWYGILFAISFAVLYYIHRVGYLFMPWSTCLIALAIGSIIVTPLMWLYALSNFQLPVGTFNELLFGYIIQKKASKHPGGASFFGCVAGDAWYRAQIHLESMKLGFYNHIPPRAVFAAQIMGELLGVPINYFSYRWVLATKWEYLVGKKTDPLHQWTGQAVVSYHTNAIQYVVLGPSRLFKNYPLLPYGFMVGAICPLIIFALHKRYPNSIFKFRLWNTTVFFSTLSHFYGNVSTGFLSKFIGATITMFYAFRYRHALWKKYNYVVAAALDTGFNLAMTIIFLLVSFGINAPNWFGNNAQNIERCFAM